MTNNLSVAYILSRFPSLTETFILREMVSLRALGLDVHVFSLFPPHQTVIHEQTQLMMPFAHYSPFLLSRQLILAQLYFVFRSPFRYIRAFIKLIWQTYREPLVLLRALAIFPKSVCFARQMQALRINHIHAHFIWINGIAAQVASDLTDITYSLHPHAFGLFMRSQECVRRQLELADGIVTVSQFHRQYIANLCQRWSPENIGIVHYGLDPTEFAPAHPPVEDDTVRIISVGSLIEKKGHEYIIDACAQLTAKGYAFRCSIVGNGPLLSALQARIDKHRLQDRVLLLGARSQKEVKDLYRQSDIFVLACVVAKSGDRDGMPNVLLEAMAMGLPVVTTPVTGIPELVCDGKNGLLVPERDVETLTHAMEQLINDTTARHKMGQQGRQTILEGFDIHKTAAQLAIILNEIHEGQL